MIPYLQRFVVLALGVKLVIGQAVSTAATHSTGWNSSFELSPEQMKLGNLTTDLGALINTITNFDRTQLAHGGAHEDDFYKVQGLLPKDKWPTEPGKTVKLQEFTDPSPFSIPAKTALSRIAYTTTDANGTLIPASAYILWPYQPKSLRGVKHTSSAPVVLWTHGTSGFYANGAPSTHRGLFYADIVPFALAEAGYAVIAPDYAGLGIDTSFDGSHIPHQYFVREAGAHDALNALRAARESFPTRLSPDYVVMGHSQGGAVAWALSETLARKDHRGFKDVAQGYRGAVIIAPPTDALSFANPGFLAWIAKDLERIYPSFNLSAWFTPLGIRRIDLLNQIEGSQMVTFAMFGPDDAILQPDWHETPYVRAFEELANPGRRPFRGPVLLVQGTEDPIVPYDSTRTTVQETCKRFSGDLEFLAVPGGSHFGAISAAKQSWLRWIEDRFEGRPVARAGCVESRLESLLPVEYYQALPNSFAMWAGEERWAYEVPTAL